MRIEKEAHTGRNMELEYAACVACSEWESERASEREGEHAHTRGREKEWTNACCTCNTPASTPEIERAKERERKGERKREKECLLRMRGLHQLPRDTVEVLGSVQILTSCQLRLSPLRNILCVYCPRKGKRKKKSQSHDTIYDFIDLAAHAKKKLKKRCVIRHK